MEDIKHQATGSMPAQPEQPAQPEERDRITGAKKEEATEAGTQAAPVEEPAAEGADNAPLEEPEIIPESSDAPEESGEEDEE